MCFAEKDTPAHHAKFRKTWNSKYKSVNWWRGAVIIPVSAAQWLWTCPSSFVAQRCWPGREGSLYRRQLPGGKGRELSGQQLRTSLHLLSPPSLHKSSSLGAVSDWCLKYPKTFPGHTTTTLWRCLPAAGAPGWHQGHVEGHLSKAKAQLFHVLVLLLWIPRTDRAVQCSAAYAAGGSPQVSWGVTPSLYTSVSRWGCLPHQAGSGLSSRVAQSLLCGSCLLPQVCPSWMWCWDSLGWAVGGPAVAGLRVPRWGFFATSPCTGPQLSLLLQVPDLWAVGPAELWQEKLFGELECFSFW